MSFRNLPLLCLSSVQFVNKQGFDLSYLPSRETKPKVTPRMYSSWLPNLCTQLLSRVNRTRVAKSPNPYRCWVRVTSSCKTVMLVNIILIREEFRKATVQSVNFYFWKLHLHDYNVIKLAQKIIIIISMSSTYIYGICFNFS